MSSQISFKQNITTTLYELVVAFYTYVEGLFVLPLESAYLAPEAELYPAYLAELRTTLKRIGTSLRRSS
jgi:hypothetical protein